MSKLTRPLMRYHGGKWRLAPWIMEHLPSHRVYVEPFGGGGSVLLRKDRSYCEVYNDLDGEVVNLFATLRDRRDELIRAVRATPFSRTEFRLAYQPSPEPVEQARRTLFRAMAGHGSTGATGRNTGFRANVTRSYTTPADDWANHIDSLPPIAERLRGVIIENEPATAVIDRYDGADTLFYVDPPYPLHTRTNTTKWDTIYKNELSNDDHRSLATQLHSVAGMVVLSGYPCELYDQELYADWTRLARKAYTDARLERTEILWLNERAANEINPAWGWKHDGIPISNAPGDGKEYSRHADREREMSGKRFRVNTVEWLNRYIDELERKLRDVTDECPGCG